MAFDSVVVFGWCPEHGATLIFLVVIDSESVAESRLFHVETESPFCSRGEKEGWAEKGKCSMSHQGKRWVATYWPLRSAWTKGVPAVRPRSVREMSVIKGVS